MDYALWSTSLTRQKLSRTLISSPSHTSKSCLLRRLKTSPHCFKGPSPRSLQAPKTKFTKNPRNKCLTGSTQRLVFSALRCSNSTTLTASLLLRTNTRARYTFAPLPHATFAVSDRQLHQSNAQPVVVLEQIFEQEYLYAGQQHNDDDLGHTVLLDGVFIVYDDFRVYTLSVFLEFLLLCYFVGLLRSLH